MTTQLLAKQDKPDRRARNKQKTRDNLIAAANRIFETKSVEKTVVKDLTDAADVAYGTFYNHFDSIGDIAEAAVECKLNTIAGEVAAFNLELKDPLVVAASGARLVFRLLRTDPTCNWFSQRVGTLVRTFEKVIFPYALKDLENAISLGRVKPAASSDICVRGGIWLLVGMYTESIQLEDASALEEELVRLYLTVLGTDHAEVAKVAVKSKSFVDSL